MLIMELYTKEGWLNFEYLKANKRPFNFVLGGRGVGKTYGALQDVYLSRIPSILIRTTQVQADFICSDKNTPFKRPLDDLGVRYMTAKESKYLGMVYEAEISGDVYRPIREICSTAALSTFHNLRGFDGSYLKQIIYDEFNEEDGRTSKKGLAETFYNLQETINRNRELEGNEPVTSWFFGNSNDIFNDLLIDMKLIAKISEMERTGKEVSIMPDIALYVLQHSPISEKKKSTALYRVTAGSAYAEMALRNQFRGFDYKLVKPLPLKQIKPVACCGEIVLYKDKSSGKDYISLHKQGHPKEYTAAEFISRFDRIAFEIAFERSISFDSPEAKVLTKRLFM